MNTTKNTHKKQSFINWVLGLAKIEIEQNAEVYKKLEQYDRGEDVSETPKVVRPRTVRELIQSL